ncbi:hypothetical protein MAM1_0107c05452 [Mucor ambiguus]|uniref:Uncharacterized protein n=1 Tax=Mucor ambiguus TaxID=91626 RepID=A0A0C9M7B4_9FUNG|nr:hypothetical protein MAM1_0107c05452 [Mucor ambiguus]
MEYLFCVESMPDKTTQSLFKEYLDAYSKEQNQQTEKEKHFILIVQQYTRQLGRELLRNEKTMFDRCQFLFCVPLGWTCSKYEEALRALFMETGWITQNDPKNRLIFSSVIEGVCQILIERGITSFERERKYLFLHFDVNVFRLLIFQMQSAKELIAVSKKLAASDFYLIPTELCDSVSISTAELRVLAYNGVKGVIMRHNKIQSKRFYKKRSFKFKNSNKKTTRKQHSNINAEAQPLFSETNLRKTT